MKDRIAALAVIAAVSVAGASACSSGKPAAAKPSQNPSQLLSAAVKNAESATSVVAATSIKTSQIPGAGALGGLGLATSGTYTGQTKPSDLREFSGTVQAGGQSMGNIDLISTHDAAYANLPPVVKTLLHTTSKPWVKVPQSELKSGGLMAAVLGEATSVNPLAFAKLLGEAKNPKIAGTATVGGVSTTEVSGSVPASTALAKLPSSLQKTFGQDGQGAIQFKAWIDGSHNFKKLQISDSGYSGSASTQIGFTVSKLNQPVTIKTPPANQASTLTAKDLKGAIGGL
ncbi:MAG: LppX_LprAFG lipoprotein [Streptosporangiales bacterium]|nr:LppX_LprAFG lipoprotein [Streptosporangiales bacterium]